MSDYSPQGFRMLPTVVKNLLIINIIIFLATMVLEKYGYNNITSMCALNAIPTGRFRLWQLVTYMFMHANWRTTGVHAGFSSITCSAASARDCATCLSPAGTSPWVRREPFMASCWPLA